MSGKYKTADAFRAALEARMRREARASGRMQQRIVVVYLMQRLVARVLDERGPDVTLKGGLALELRLQRARSTNDIDLRVTGNVHDVIEKLMCRVTRDDEPDRLTFAIEEHPTHPRIDSAGVVYEGVRLRAQALLAGKKYGPRFGLDLGVGDPLVGPIEHRRGPNLLDIIDASPVDIPLYPLPTHVAEKLHAYTLPREGSNTRMKDLIDLALIASELALDGRDLRSALETTFGFRRSHALPPRLPPQPPEWTSRYTREQRLNTLPWATIDEVHAEAARFVDPILAGGGGGGGGGGAWAPSARRWGGALG